jgi:hypothetical protein
MTSEAQVIDVSNVDGVALVCFKDLAFAIRENRFSEVEGELWTIVDQETVALVVLEFDNKELPTCHVVQQLLIRLHKRLNDNLRLCNLPPMALWHFEWNRLADRLNIYTTREGALADKR